MRLRHLALAAAVLTVAPVNDCTGQAHAQAPGCGGHDATRTIPTGSEAVCQNVRTLLDGQAWPSAVIFRSDGSWFLTVSHPVAADEPIPLEVEVHFGESGSGGFTFNGTLPAGRTQGQLAGRVDPAAFTPYGCHLQFDAKAFNGEADTPSNLVRLAGPHFQFESCAPAPTTSSPTSSTTPTVAPTTGAPSTTPGPGSSSVPGSGGTLPATGPRRLDPFLLGSFMLLVLGAGIVLAARRRSDA